MRDMAQATGISISTLCWALKTGIMKRRSSRLKLLLTDANKRERLAFCGAQVTSPMTPSTSTLLLMIPKALMCAASAGTLREVAFCGMWDVVHLDEKWFNADKHCRKEYLVDDETPGTRSCKSKRFLPKVMFLRAVARPRQSLGFDRKIELWPFVNQTPALRACRNRPAGTMVSKTTNVEAETFRDYVLNKVVPAIKAKFPSISKCVSLQHDNATPHSSIDDKALAKQPPNSPDLNVLDLGFFAPIQTLQYKMFSRSVDDVIASTMVAFDTLEADTLENVFLTLQAVMRLALEQSGGNLFKLPHLNKAAMRHAGNLVVNLTCPVSLLFEANGLLQTMSP
ncbi:hypothetical protein H310_06263 [Aphanomyces invadans]|uniref:Tc1-like transposase DDE domain-containing protein n=1 Tax=Aphanomyces invadans TaxID=157072 RepID=A0A024U6V8_9STRA|nr:hypothetical protein H310_06263 [Aphanomyces invadans]ETW01632.1 hypothetical protein H310_06263 [Aphanomyces invadans]|eukprot:XP_008869480.1 hypothetical protein H310_06263 [Aphanomyces invadans]